MYQQWPNGTDFSDCLQCLRNCARYSCPGVGAARCVIKLGCRCPAIIHKLQGGLCGHIVADPSKVYQRYGEPWKELRNCVLIDKCVPSGVIWVRQIWKIVWLNIVMIVSIGFCFLWSRGSRYVRVWIRKDYHDEFSLGTKDV